LIGNGTEPDQLRGPQHDAAWCDGLARPQSDRAGVRQIEASVAKGSRPHRRGHMAANQTNAEIISSMQDTFQHKRIRL
jgi:phage terminase large subunit-like protein